MTKHRFFTKPENIKGKFVSIFKDQAKQIKNVLHLKKGDEIILLDDSGKEYLVSLDIVANDDVRGRILRLLDNKNEPNINITLYQSLLPREKFEMVLQKGTECGISKFVPVETERSIPSSKVTSKDRLERWQRIIKESAEQSERGLLPSIVEAVTYKEAINKAILDGPVLICFERDINNNLKSVLQDLKNNISIFIGPEGGFTPKEIELAKEKGASLVSLGPRILRSETAGPVLSSIILYATEN